MVSWERFDIKIINVILFVMGHKALKLNKLTQKKEIGALGHVIQIQMVKYMHKGCIQRYFLEKKM